MRLGWARRNGSRLMNFPTDGGLRTVYDFRGSDARATRRVAPQRLNRSKADANIYSTREMRHRTLGRYLLGSNGNTALRVEPTLSPQAW